MRGLTGTFAVLPLAELVQLLARRRATGSLTCERGTVRKTIHLADGTAVGAASNDPREFLGQLLVNFGHITDEQLTHAFRTQEETKVRLGKVLSIVGLVPPETVREVLALKIRETLLDVFLWDSGVFWVDDAPPPAVDELDAAIPLADVVKEAEFRSTAWSAFRGEFPTGAAALEVDESRIPPAVGKDTVDGRVVALARNGKTIDEIGLALHATEFHLYQRLYALARQGVLKTVSPPSASAGGDGRSGEALGATDLVERARQLLAEERVDEAELAATKAAELAPGSDAVRSILAKAERVLHARLGAELLSQPRLPRTRVSAEELARLRIPAADMYLLSRCDGSRDVRQLAELAPLREIDVLKALRRLVDANLVDLA